MTKDELSKALLREKPYFGPALRALQGDPARHRYFKPTINRSIAQRAGPVRVLEIGSWAGASAITWAHAIKDAGQGGSVMCVDLWAPYFGASESEDHYRDMTAAAKSGDIYRLFLHNIRFSGVGALIEHRIADSRTLPTLFEPGSFDIVYIDGSHAFELVKADIQSALTLIAPNGIICGDDLEALPCALDPDAHRVALSSGVDYTFSEAARKFYHPGVTEAVSAVFAAPAIHEGFWAVEQRAGKWVAANLDIANAELPPHIQSAVEPDVALVGAVGEYNIVRKGDKFVGVSRTLGPIDIFADVVGDRDLGALVVTGADLEEVRAKALALIEHQAEQTRAQAQLENELRSRIESLEQALQNQKAELEADLARNARAFKSDLEQYVQGMAALGAQVEEMRSALDQRSVDINSRMTARMEGHIAGMDHRLDDLEVHTDEALAAIDARTEAALEELRNLTGDLAREAIEADVRINELERARRRSLVASLFRRWKQGEDR